MKTNEQAKKRPQWTWAELPYGMMVKWYWQGKMRWIFSCVSAGCYQIIRESKSDDKGVSRKCNKCLRLRRYAEAGIKPDGSKHLLRPCVVCHKNPDSRVRTCLDCRVKAL